MGSTIIHKLKHVEVAGAKPQAKDYKMMDGAGLYLLVKPNGSRYWRKNYRHNGKQNTKAFGKFPDVSLSQARALNEAFNVETDDSKTLQEAFDQYLKVKKTDITLKHQLLIYARCKPILDELGSRKISSIKTPEFVNLMRKIEERTLSVARKVRTDFNQCYEFAIASGWCENNPVVNIRRVLKTYRAKHFPAITKPAEVGKLLNLIHQNTTSSIIVKAYMLLLPLVFCRPSELRKAKWSEFDLDAKLWKFKLSKKLEGNSVDHIAPLSKQAVIVLKELKKYTGTKEHVFVNIGKDTVISDAAAGMVFKRAGYKDLHCSHGWRATARTLIIEELHYEEDKVEHQLGHLVRDPNGRAYNRTEFIKIRTEMMQKWADYLDKIRE